MRRKRKLWAYKGAAMKTTTTYRQKDNGWQIIVSWKDTSGKWHQKSKQGFPLKKDAKEAESDLIAQIKKAPQPVERAMASITLKDFCKIFVQSKKSLSTNTKQQYKVAVNALGTLAEKPVNKITFLDLQATIGGWRMKPQTQKQYKAKLVILFRSAVKPYGLISATPMTDIEVAKERIKTERLTISELQFKQLMNLKIKQPVKLAAALCYYAGLRRGEMLGLTWPDIKDMTITVSKQLALMPQAHFTAPKTKNSFRTIPIPPVLMQMLSEYRSSRPIDIHRRLFPRPVGTYESLARALRKINPLLSPHCLRHTYATNLLANGVDIRTVAALMGDDTKTVINTYVHYSDEMRAAAADSIQKIFSVNF